MYTLQLQLYTVSADLQEVGAIIFRFVTKAKRLPLERRYGSLGIIVFLCVFDDDLFNDIGCMLTQVAAAFQTFIDSLGTEQHLTVGRRTKQLIHSFCVDGIRFGLNVVDADDMCTQLRRLFEVAQLACRKMPTQSPRCSRRSEGISKTPQTQKSSECAVPHRDAEIQDTRALSTEESLLIMHCFSRPFFRSCPSSPAFFYIIP